MANGGEGEAEIDSALKIKWADHVADHDYSAAEAYLSLKLDEEASQKP
jgi:hypothetical protein